MAWFLERSGRRRFLAVPRLLLLVVALAACGPALAAGPEYRLGPGDKILVTIYEMPDTSIEHTVSVDGDMVLPLLGGVPVSGKTVVEVRRDVAAAFVAKGLLRQATVAVEVLARRPFYVTGAVVTPGAYEYRPGLTVRQALALAGGAGTGAPGARQAGDALRLQGEHDALRSELLHLLALASRLQARAAGAETIDFNALGPLAQIAGAQGVMDLEREQFAAESARLREEEALAAELLAQSDGEIKTLQRRIANLEQSVELQNQELEAMRKPFSQGLVPTSRIHELERLSSRLQDDHLDVIARAARAERDHIELGHRLEQLRADQRMETTSKLQDTRLRIEQVRAMLQSVRARLGAADEQETGWDLRMVVHRADGNDERMIQATPLTPIAPGDVLEVSIGLALAGRAPHLAAAAMAAERPVPLSQSQATMRMGE